MARSPERPLTADHVTPEEPQLAMYPFGPHKIPDGCYYDDYEVGTWLVVIGGRIVGDSIPDRDQAERIYRHQSLQDLEREV